MSLVGSVVTVNIVRDVIKMPELEKVTCVECLMMDGAYISVVNCRKCNFFLKDIGRILICGYTYTKLVPEEKSTGREPVSRW